MIIIILKCPVERRKMELLEALSIISFFFDLGPSLLASYSRPMKHTFGYRVIEKYSPKIIVVVN